MTRAAHAIMLAGLLLASVAGAQDLGEFGSTSGGDFLHPEEAFVVHGFSDGDDRVLLEWEIADGYYLYQERFDFSLDGEAELGEARFPEAETIEDEWFGVSEVHFHRLVIELPVSGANLGDALDLNIRYQGCAEDGLCYPPLDRAVSVELGGDDRVPEVGASEDPATGEATSSEQDRLAGLVADAHPAVVAAAFFGLGLLLSLTPCVLPMVPILSSLILGQGPGISTGRAFGLSLTYVLAMAVTYTAAGVAAGLAGHNLQASLQHPAVLVVFAAVFVALALAMFGFYQLQVPQGLQDRINRLAHRQSAGSYTGVGVMGFLSALVVGPCVAAPLAGALLVISQTGDALQGGVALFSMSLGMGVLLLVVGTSAGRLMPRTGPWMTAIKAAFGVLLLAVAIWMLERILPPAAYMSLWAALLVISGIYLGALEPVGEGRSGWYRLWKGVGLLALAWGLLTLIGGAAGGNNPLRPLHGVTLAEGGAQQLPDFQPAAESERIDRLIAEAERPVMLEFYADWCIECRNMERNTFTDSEVQAKLENFELIKADVTDYTAAHRELLERHELFGPPAILFFPPGEPEEVREMRLVGEKGPEPFIEHLSRVREAMP